MPDDALTAAPVSPERVRQRMRVHGISQEEAEKMDAIAQRAREAMRVLTDPIRESARLTAADYAITINCRE